jgi:hypothetical protein
MPGARVVVLVATRAELDQQAAAQNTAVSRAQAQLKAGVAAAGLTAAILATPAGAAQLKDLLAGVVSTWGAVAGTLAADFYDTQREAARLPGLFQAIVPDPLNQAQVDGVIDWAIGSSRGPSLEEYSEAHPNTSLAAFQEEQAKEILAEINRKIDASAQRLVKQAYRDTVSESMAHDPQRRSVRVARIPSGPHTCAFCLVMASRGYVYRSSSNAGKASGSGIYISHTNGEPLVDEYINKYHDGCDCRLDVSFTLDSPLPAGYDPDELYEQYATARGALGMGPGDATLKPILAQMREMYGYA